MLHFTYTVFVVSFKTQWTNLFHILYMSMQGSCGRKRTCVWQLNPDPNPSLGPGFSSHSPSGTGSHRCPHHLLKSEREEEHKWPWTAHHWTYWMCIILQLVYIWTLPSFWTITGHLIWNNTDCRCSEMIKDYTEFGKMLNVIAVKSHLRGLQCLHGFLSIRSNNLGIGGSMCVNQTRFAVNLSAWL